MQRIMILNPAGGLRYHFKAFKNRRDLWADFRHELALWLAEWQPREKNLLLVGPSGGYTLPLEFLNRFESISAVEPDPVARWIFERGHGIEVAWSRENFFLNKHKEFDLSRLRLLLDVNPDRAVLFCNILGQLACLYPEATSKPAFAEWKKGLVGALSGRSWASYHDRLSGVLEPVITSENRTQPRSLTNTELTAKFYSGTGELTDHELEGAFTGLPARYLAWTLTPGQTHLIEATKA
jgi:hypothetical protein